MQMKWSETMFLFAIVIAGSVAIHYMPVAWAEPYITAGLAGLGF